MCWIFILVGEVGSDRYRRLISSIRLDMLKAIGKPYIAQHCVNAMQQEAYEKSYRAYITDALAGLVGMECRWVDTLPDFNTPARPQQSAEEIKARILAGLNGGDTP